MGKDRVYPDVITGATFTYDGIKEAGEKAVEKIKAAWTASQ